MSQISDQDVLVDRLRANLRSAGIAADERDLEGLVAKGFLRIPATLDELARRMTLEVVPDYLGDWGPTRAGYSDLPAAPDVALGGEIGAMAEQIRTRSVSPVELTQQALDRIAARDGELSAFQLVLADQALAQARRAEQEILHNAWRGPLHGIPVAVKDLLAMRGTITTAGALILADNMTYEDAAGVERLQQAGAIIVGKTRMSEFAYAPGSINAHFGPTANPHALDRDTGGSSSGSAAAVADGIVYAALGTDTGGSIRIPAGLCGIVGLKPTFGRVSLFGATTLSWSLDHLGPLTRTVADTALLLDLLSGYDARDPRSRPTPPASFAAALAASPDELNGLRIGVLRNDAEGSLAAPEILASCDSALARLVSAGATLVELELPDVSDLRVVSGAILAQEALAYHQPNLRTRLHDFGEFMRQRMLAAYAYDSGAFVRAQQLRAVMRRRWNTLFDQIDLLALPATPHTAPPLGTPSTVANTNPFNLLGWPTISVPAEPVAGLPVGLQLAGRPWDEATVLRAARTVVGR